MDDRIVLNTDGLKIETLEGFKDFHGIIKLDNEPCLRFELESGKTIEVSINHKFIIGDTVVLAHELLEGFVLDTKDGSDKITSITYIGEHDVYDILEVSSSDHSYYINDINNSNCKFLGSSVTLVDSDILERINPIEPIMTKYGDLMKVFEQPITGKHHYICSVDTAGGVGSDYSVIQVMKINSHNNIEQVATYANNTIKPFDFAEICIAISEYYLNAFMMIENNEMGGEVANRIWYDYECDRILNTDPKGIGTRSTRKTKLIANMLTKRYLEEGWLKIYNYETIRQFSLYEEISPNVFKGPRTDHDDHVTSMLWSIYYLQTPFYTDGVEVVRKEIRDVYKLLPDEESDKVIINRNRIAGMFENIKGDDVMPIAFDDEFEWPADLNS